MWSRKKDTIALKQREVDSAVASAADQRREADEARSTLMGLLEGLARLNKENNFSPKLERALIGRE